MKSFMSMGVGFFLAGIIVLIAAGGFLYGKKLYDFILNWFVSRYDIDKSDTIIEIIAMLLVSGIVLVAIGAIVLGISAIILIIA